jgi:hypothetical protein
VRVNSGCDPPIWKNDFDVWAMEPLEQVHVLAEAVGFKVKLIEPL